MPEVRVKTFAGKTKDFDSVEERNISKAALKAYLKGKVKFSYGYTTIGSRRVKAWFNVPIKYK